VEGFVDKWDDLIDWKRRAQSEGSFFIDQLKQRGATKVLDVSTGTGFHSLRLIEAGFDVVSVDGSSEMLAKAFSNGMDRGEVLQTVHADWRWLNRDVNEKFDAIICLGNSFTHLFHEMDRRKTLAEFYAALRHDGVLILDQRNYDALLDGDYSHSHTYYYCGDDIAVAPEYVDDGLSRFRYDFPDGATYYLNMFPLRREYVRRLLREVGFTRVDTYGDFQETYRADEPDFFIHVADKRYSDPSAEPDYSQAVSTAREYYNSTDADTFYHTIWGGEDIHVGLYETPDEPIAPASRRTVETMAQKVDLTSDSRVLDIGAGYGGAARQMAKAYGCSVVALNLSEVENARDRTMNAEQGLDHLIDVVDGSFEDLPYPDDEFDVVWCQDSMLHSGDRVRVLAEVARVLKPGGEFVFTDPMAADDCPPGVLQPILDRIHLETLGSPRFYRETLQRLNFRDISFDDLSHQLPRHYGRVREEMHRMKPELEGKVSDEYVDRMDAGLGHWVEGGNAGHLAWGIFRARRA
jgi:glycine/sarcosine/dimethylglycine N-methyltransferase